LLLTVSTSLAGCSIYVIFAYLFNCKEVEILEKLLVIIMNVLENWRNYLKKSFIREIYFDSTERQ
jgi:hypothetical protein